VLSASRLTLLFLAVLYGRGVGAENVPTTGPAPIHITDVDGQDYEPLNVSAKHAAVLFFVLQDCPICNSYAPQIEQLHSEFAPRGVSFYLVHVDSTLSQSAAIKHARDFGYTIPVLIDRQHDLVKRLSVDVVPTAVVIGADGAPQYKGRIDDLYAGIGKPRTLVTTHDLLDALVAVLEGKPVERSQTSSVGCAVPDLPAHVGDK